MSADPARVAARLAQLYANRDEVQAVVNYLDSELDTQVRELARIEKQIRAVRALAPADHERENDA